MPRNYLSKKHITQIQASPPGWFALFASFGYMKKEDRFAIEGCIAVPVAGWAICKGLDAEDEIVPFFGDGKLLDLETYKNFEKVVFRPD